MANIIKLGSLCLDDHLMAAGREYIPGQRISIKDTKPGNELCWVVVNGLLIADRCLLTNISWDNLEQQGMVFGKQLCIDGAKYLCRLLKLGNQKAFRANGLPHLLPLVMTVMNSGIGTKNLPGDRNLQPSMRFGEQPVDTHRLMNGAEYCPVFVILIPVFVLCLSQSFQISAS